MELDISNDPEIERLGADATAKHASSFWSTLTEAARLDGLDLDPLWDDDADQGDRDDGSMQFNKTYALCPPDTESKSAIRTRCITFVNPHTDARLYARFRSNFSSLPIYDVSPNSPSFSPQSLNLWRTFLETSSDGMPDYNFMTLLRECAHDPFWMDVTHCSPGLLVVPRAQFVYVELARSREGWYGRNFRKVCRLYEYKGCSDALVEYSDRIRQRLVNDSGGGGGGGDDHLLERICARARRAVRDLGTRWPFPTRAELIESGAGKAVRRAAAAAAATAATAVTEADSNELRIECESLLRRWKDLLELGKIRRNLLSSGGGDGDSGAAAAAAASAAALERVARESARAAAHVAPSSFKEDKTNVSSGRDNDASSSTGVAQKSFYGSGTNDGINDVSSPSTSDRTSDVVPSSPAELDVTDLSPTDAAKIFHRYGLCYIKSVLPHNVIDACIGQSASSLEALIDEQLRPRNLTLDDDFDFLEVRHRPGNRLDSRYRILDRGSPCANVALHTDVINTLLRTIFGQCDAGRLELLYAGIVHAFGSPPPERQSGKDSSGDDNDNDCNANANANAKTDERQPQVWHRDGPSLFPNDVRHPTHCVNVFVPLVDVFEQNGCTEFVPGTHNDDVFEMRAGQVVRLAEKDPHAKHDHAVRVQVEAGSVIVFDMRLMHRGLANRTVADRPVLYMTFGMSWWNDEHMFLSESLFTKNSDEVRARKSMLLDLYRAVAGGTEPDDPNLEDYGHPHYTNRFDLILSDLFQTESDGGAPIRNHLTNDGGDNDGDCPEGGGEGSSDTLSKVRVNANRNLGAIIKFLSCSEKEKWDAIRAITSALKSEEGASIKAEALRAARERRRLLRRKEERFDEIEAEVEKSRDFATIEADMSDVSYLYGALTRTLLQGPMGRFGFTQDQDGLCIMLAAFKAYCQGGGAGGMASSRELEEAFTCWWHAGPAVTSSGSRFMLRRKKGAVSREEEEREKDEIAIRSGRSVLVVFSSLGSGIARPEWSGTLEAIGAPNDELDVLHVVDPAFSWYHQDPTALWDGYSYYRSGLVDRIRGYGGGVMYMGDSMGGAAALRFSDLADVVLSFTPQVDIGTYGAIRRIDFPPSLRRGFLGEVRNILLETKAKVIVHYGDKCKEDIHQVSLLPDRPSHITLVSHDYDDHVLSLHLRHEGKLHGVVAAAVAEFLKTIE